MYYCPKCGKIPWTWVYKINDEVIGCDNCIKKIDVEDALNEEEEVYKSTIDT